MGRPKLGPITKGDKVFIRRRTNRQVTTTPAMVTKVGRVWITLETQPDGRGERFRLDTQKSEHTFGYTDQFVTADQLAYDLKTIRANEFLREQGIEVRRESRWYGSNGAIALAEILRDAPEFACENRK